MARRHTGTGTGRESDHVDGDEPAPRDAEAAPGEAAQPLREVGAQQPGDDARADERARHEGGRDDAPPPVVLVVRDHKELLLADR